MSKFNFLFTLFKQATNAAKAGDVPELTNFLKSSQVFKTVAWKIHDLKNNTISKMDDIAFKDDPHNKPKNYNDHNHNHKRNNHSHNSNNRNHK